MLLAALLLQNIDPAPPVRQPGYAEIRAMSVPVISGDINDRPYRVVGNIEAKVAAEPIERTALIFVGRTLEASGFRESSLYDAAYQRRFRGRE